MPAMIPPGQLFILSAPSGVGKSTLIEQVMARQPRVRFSVSWTTRQPRQGEIPGRHYHFKNRSEFTAGIKAGRFLEWAEVHGEYYGTDWEQIHQWLTAGEDVILDIDVQGARLVRCLHPSVRTIFILPPSLEVLGERLRSRGTESVEQVARRLEAARREVEEAPWYDYLVVNDVLADAVADLEAIFRACRCERVYRASSLQHLLL